MIENPLKLARFRGFFMAGVAVIRSAVSALGGLALAACGPSDGGFEPTPPEQRGSPYAPDGERCTEGLKQGELTDRMDSGDPDALRCFLSIRDVEPDSFNLRYRIYRIEGVEPEGLDALVRSRTREELSIDLANLHNGSTELDPVEFAPGSACRMFDPVARELLSRIDNPEETTRCRRWGY